MAIDRGTWPAFVRLALAGITSRTMAWVCLWISVALAALSIAIGFKWPIAFTGGLMLLAALWYYLAIRWVDQNSRWS